MTPIAKKHPVPHFTGTLGMIWFISGLSMLFGAMILGYFIIRTNRAGDVQFGTLKLPWGFWLSTALVLVASATIQSAVRAIRRERQDLLRAWMVVTLIVGITFCIVQTPCMASLVKQHLANRHAYESAGGTIDQAAAFNPFFGLIFVFILVHALHVVGGLVQLGMVTVGAFQGKYDHEYYNPVKHSAMYWHFLDAVWLVMYGMLVLAG